MPHFGEKYSCIGDLGRTFSLEQGVRPMLCITQKMHAGQQIVEVRNNYDL